MSQSVEDLTFSIDSRLLEELGENLVTRNHVAVAELIKNAYDADATEVEIAFTNARQDEGGDRSEIRIDDDGTGMTYNEIQENWMRIGTTDKVRNPRTEEYGRQKTGNKGIGRFSCRRLGYRLELTATAEDPESDQYMKTEVDFQWDDFARNTNVDTIEVPADVEYLDEAETGVTLRILDLRDEWTQRDFNTLRRNVLTLSVVQQQRRDGYKEDPGFEISFDAPEFAQGEGSLLDQVYQAGWCKLNGEFTEEGDVELSIEAKNIGKRSYTIKNEYDGLAGSGFKIAFIPKDKEHFRDTSTLSLERAKEVTNSHGGIRVYKNGFRVYPYGGPDDDWLGIDRYYSRRIGSPDDELENLSGEMEFHKDFNRTMLLHPRNENLIGRISIASDADLQMKTDREGFIQNQAFEDLKDGVRLALQWLTLQYSNYQSLVEREQFEKKAEKFLEQVGDQSDDGPTENKSQNEDDNSSTLSEWDSGKSSGSSSRGNSKESASSSSSSTTSSGSNRNTEAVDQAVSVIQQASETVSNSTTEEDEEISDVVESASEIIQQSIKKNRKEIDFYRSAFSVNQFVFSFMHELRDMILKLETKRSDLETTADSLSSPQSEEIQEIADEIDDMKNRFEQQMDLFGVLTDSQDDASRKKQRVKKETDNLVESVGYISNEYKITLDSDVPNNLYTPPMHQTELYSILVNLMTNSIKAVIADSSGDDRILIEGTKENDQVILRVHDTGVGISPEYHDEVTQPLISDPEKNLYDSLEKKMPTQLSSQLGSGSGLGLSIVSDIAEKYGGNLEFVDSDGWETTAEVRLNAE